jgi:hypothetical protein
MITITAIHLVGGEQHENIAEVKWENASNGQSGVAPKAEMVSYVKANPGNAVVQDSTSTIPLEIFDADPPYVRTRADDKWTDNLLALPKY